MIPRSPSFSLFFLFSSLHLTFYAHATPHSSSPPFIHRDHTALSPSVSAPVDVFVAGEGGYFCIKIPSLTLTSHGTLLALGEARRNNCSDYTTTDLVFKRSIDNGVTWCAGEERDLIVEILYFCFSSLKSRLSLSYLSLLSLFPM